jgi:hypothetical protein
VQSAVEVAAKLVAGYDRDAVHGSVGLVPSVVSSHGPELNAHGATLGLAPLALKHLA